MEKTGQKFTDLLLQKAKSENAKHHHFDGSTNEVIRTLASSTKGKINGLSIEEIFGIKKDKTQSRLSCIKEDGDFIINHVTEDDECFIVTLVEPEEITVLKFPGDQLLKLKSKQNGEGDYMVTRTKDELLSVNHQILTHL